MRLNEPELLSLFEKDCKFVMNNLKRLDIGTKISFLEKIEEKGEPLYNDILISLSKDKNPEVRYKAVEILANLCSTEKDISAIIAASEDKDELVRIMAAEGMGYIGNPLALPVLEKMLLDKSQLVRGYSAESMAIIVSKAELAESRSAVEKIIEEALANENRNAAKIRFYVALFRLGNSKYFNHILKMLNTKSYRVLCATANYLEQLAVEGILDQAMIKKALDELKKARQKNQTIAAVSSISEAIEGIEEYIKEHN